MKTMGWVRKGLSGSLIREKWDFVFRGGFLQRQLVSSLETVWTGNLSSDRDKTLNKAVIILFLNWHIVFSTVLGYWHFILKYYYWMYLLLNIYFSCSPRTHYLSLSLFFHPLDNYPASCFSAYILKEISTYLDPYMVVIQA